MEAASSHWRLPALACTLWLCSSRGGKRSPRCGSAWWNQKRWSPQQREEKLPFKPREPQRRLQATEQEVVKAGHHRQWDFPIPGNLKHPFLFPPWVILNCGINVILVAVVLQTTRESVSPGTEGTWWLERGCQATFLGLTPVPGKRGGAFPSQGSERQTQGSTMGGTSDSAPLSGSAHLRFPLLVAYLIWLQM